MKTRITDLLSIRSPILLGGMAGVTDAVLAAAVSEAGGLGTIAAAKESGRGLRQAVAELRKLTEKPFAVNIPLIVPQVEELIAGVIESRVPVVITAAGNPALYTSTLKEAGITVIHVIPCVDSARKAERAGVDALIAEGFRIGRICLAVRNRDACTDSSGCGCDRNTRNCGRRRCGCTRIYGLFDPRGRRGQRWNRFPGSRRMFEDRQCLALSAHRRT